ncbi:MAG: hypothetical protein KAT16_05745 [Candidatus Heimdallarchaeota archaeon]|nr:hypothetical protein [Candidatus Heimdallarchaeota archaeon]
MLLLILGEAQPEVDGIRINQIWITKDPGLCLFYASFAKDKEILLDKSVFASIFTAISDFVSEATKTPIRKITLANNIALHHYKKDNLLICLAAEKEIQNEVLLSKFLSNIMDEFERDYKPLIASDSQFDGRAFENFQSKLLEILSFKFYSRKIPSFKLLFILLDKVLDRVVTSVISGEKIAVIGDETQTEVIITTLEQFCPHIDLKKVYWTNTAIGKADFVGIPRKLERSYADQGYKIVDTENLGKFKGTSNNFVSKIIKDVKDNDDPRLAVYIIETRINYFISRTSTIMDLYKRNEVDRKAMTFLRKDIDKDLFDLIVRYIKNILDPDFKLPGKKNIWRRLDEF